MTLEPQSQEINKDEEEEVRPLTSEGDIENHPSFKFIPKGHHEWKQNGYYIICQSCDLDHAIWIGRKHMLVGIREDGMPIIKSRAELGFV